MSIDAEDPCVVRDRRGLVRVRYCGETGRREGADNPISIQKLKPEGKRSVIVRPTKVPSH